MSKMRFFNTERKIKRLKPLTTSGKELESSHNRRFSIFSPFFLDFFSISSQTPQLLRASARTTHSSQLTTHSSQLTTQDSFTLIEVLIAIAILAVGLLGILTLLPYAIRTTADVLHNSIAPSIAQSVFLYDLQATDALEGLAEGDTIQYPPHGSVPYRVNGEPTRYSWTATIIGRDEGKYDVQLAVWSDYGLKISGADIYVVESSDEGVIYALELSSEEKLKDLQPGDYVRPEIAGGKWREIDDVEMIYPWLAKIKVLGTWDVSVDKAEVASRYKLIALYDGQID
jgi:prepilin-type N-terminal cleavage/methylation domain-containing protein